MPVRCPVSESWNCESCGRQRMCYHYVREALEEAGLPTDIAGRIAIAWKYNTSEIWW